MSTISVQSQRGLDVFMRKGKRTFASRKRKIAGLCAFVLAGVLSVGAYAFTASNEVPAQSAGGGAAKVTGYKETGVSYTWSLTGEDITAVEFELAGSQKPSDVAVALSNEEKPKAEEWVDCPGTNVTGVASPWLVKCEFKGGKGAWETTAKQAAYKFPAGVPNKEGNQLTVSAVSEGKVLVE